MSAEVWHLRARTREIHGQTVEVKRLVQRWRMEPKIDRPASRFHAVGWHAQREARHRPGFSGLQHVEQLALAIYLGMPYPLRVRR